MTRGLTLAQAARGFWRYPSPWILSAALAAALVARLAAGDWRLSDAIVPLALALAFPFVEWVIHVIVLHWRPRRLAAPTTSTRGRPTWCSSHSSRWRVRWCR